MNSGDLEDTIDSARKATCSISSFTGSVSVVAEDSAMSERQICDAYLASLIKGPKRKSEAITQLKPLLVAA